MRITLSVFLLALPLAAWAQPSPAPITEAEALRMGLARSGLADLEQARVQAAQADVLGAGLPPNPVLSYSRDRVNGSPDTLEQSLVLSQAFDLSGRRALRREAAQRRVEMAGAENASRRAELAAEIRRTFHDLLFRQENIHAAEIWMGRFDRVEVMVARLAKAGEASGYDRRRLSRERREIEAHLAAERAERDRLGARLAALTGMGRDATVSGSLVPPTLPPIETALSTLEQRPDLVAMVHRAGASALEDRAAQRGGIPEVTVGIGPKWVDSGVGTDNGLALSVSVPLPIFDRQQAARQRAEAEGRQARAELQLARERAEGELRGLHRQAQALRAAALDYRAQTVTATPELLRIAEAAYHGGESGLLELLDAYRGALAAETTALELEKRARDVRIEYDLLTGSVTE